MTLAVDEKPSFWSAGRAQITRSCEALRPFLSSTAGLSLSEAERSKLSAELLEDLVNRAPYWLGIMFVGSMSVIAFGRYDPSNRTMFIFWAAGLLALMLLYVPLSRATHNSTSAPSRTRLARLELLWVCWAVSLSIMWLTATWLLSSQPSGTAEFVLAKRTFVYLSVLGFVFPVLLLSSSRTVVLGMLLGLLLFFHFFLASMMELSNVVILIVYWYSPIFAYFVIAWFIPINQLRVRARGIQLETARARADAERFRANHFVATISHDLRQPLTALALKLDSLTSRASAPEALSDLGILKQQVDSIEGLVNGSLDLSRLEAGTWRVRIREVSLAHVVDNVASELKSEASEKGLDFEANSLPYIVRTDPQALERILRNLIGNAIRYTPSQQSDGKRGKIVLECVEHEGKIKISVIDNGHGIPKEKISTIFDEYVQLGNPERNRAKGLGLGLSIVRGLAHLLSVDLEVTSTEGKGSRFSISLPVVARVPPELRGPIAVDIEPNLKGMVVVLIDDDPVPRAQLKTRLIEWGCNVIDGASASEVVVHFLAQEDLNIPNFIVSDFRLADGTDGIHAIASVRRELGSHIPAAVWSAETSEPKLKEISDAGLEFFSKPPNSKHLAAALEKAYAERSAA